MHKSPCVDIHARNLNVNKMIGQYDLHRILQKNQNTSGEILKVELELNELQNAPQKTCLCLTWATGDRGTKTRVKSFI